MKPQAIKALAVLTASLLSLSVAAQVAAKDRKSKPMQEPAPKQESTPKNKQHAEPPVSADREAAHVKTEIQKIQVKPISKNEKLKELQTLRDREMSKDHPSKTILKKITDTAQSIIQNYK